MEPLQHSRAVCIALDWDDTLCPTTWLMQQKVDSAGNLSSKVRARAPVAFMRGAAKGAAWSACAPPAVYLSHPLYRPASSLRAAIVTTGRTRRPRRA
jgi:hypothetical protein